MKKFLFAAVVIMYVVIAPLSVSEASGKLGLLIVAHGSPSPRWNEPVLALEAEVKALLSKDRDNPYREVIVALMEFSKPSIYEALEKMEQEGIERVFVLPLFIAPSGHSHFDIPAILGTYYEPEKVEELKKEGTKIVNTGVKVTIGPTLSEGNILKDITLDRVRELSSDPRTESLVILAHGDEDFQPVWEGLCREIGAYVCAETGIPYFDFAFVEIGQSFVSEGAPVILKAASKSRKVIVAGLYLVTGAEDVAGSSTVSFGHMKMDSKSMFRGKNVVFSKKGILPDTRVSRWIVDRAMEYAGTRARLID